MTRGRPTAGAGLVEGLAGSPAAKQRLTLILETLAGRRTVVEASRRLGLSERRFYALREQGLQQALRSLEPRPVGRPPGGPAALDAERSRLEAEVRGLRLELRAAQVREEIAVALPHLLRRRAPAKKPRPSPAPSRRSDR
jgi:hypothetical protein